ncbi:MAG TPA: N,N-dimethylformamidase beta subunit family domain-containing protein, partial [Aestuariivirgaceae bacterium]|nr:N,N-dimethylformamidase beta subunit family domain-containing protein [Aestuariivirgaceae bacterium]
MLTVVGYPDRYSVPQGGTINFMISLEKGDSFEATLVRVTNGDSNPAGPGLKLPHVPSVIDGSYRGLRQRIDAGSYMRAPSVPALQTFTFTCMVWPTLPERGFQTIAAQGSWQLGLDAGRLCLRSGGPSLRLDAVMLPRRWYAVELAVDGRRGQVRMTQTPLQPVPLAGDEGALSRAIEPLAKGPKGFWLAGCPQSDGTVGEHFDGKIEQPAIARVARWDFSREISSTRAADVSGHRHHGELVNLPARAMKGHNWDGSEHRYALKPAHYGAIHFHHDDLYDAGWEPSVSFKVPTDLKSGPYALHVVAGDSDADATRETYIPFFVTPRRGSKRETVAFLAPTCSYMAYANHAEHITAREAERVVGRLLQFGHTDLYMYDHPELGGSLYDSHLDGSGVCYSSRLRPVLNFASRYHSWLGGAGSALWQYNADTHLFDWLDHQGIGYDTITDEDLHKEGYKLLKHYRTILTGTHPEYHSTAMWDGMKAWLDAGGRLMYLGANGWYWRIAFHKTLPGVIEVRRAEDGIRTWEAQPGEYHHSFNGELGGLWRRIGRPPNVMCGVGFIAQGFDVCSYYRRGPDSHDERAAFIFKGVTDEIIGDFGLIGGGAAGLELDCISTRLGSPPHTLRLASSENHSALVALVNEEFGVVPPNLGGDQND